MCDLVREGWISLDRQTMMTRNPRTAVRSGSILPFLVLGLTALMGFVALAVDLGVMAIARGQSQNAADAAATAGARTLTGDPATDNNAANVAANAYAAAEANYILGSAITDSQVAVQIGTYTYNSATQSF